MAPNTRGRQATVDPPDSEESGGETGGELVHTAIQLHHLLTSQASRTNLPTVSPHG